MSDKQETFYGFPVWEIAVFVLAILLIMVVFVLWWFFGYSFVIVPTGSTVNAPLLAALLA